jgi:hypothetical protein
MREITLKPVLTDEQVAALDNQFLSGEHCRETITTSTVARTSDGRVRLVFARNVFSQAEQEILESNIGRIGYSAKQSNRAAVHGQEGTEAVWGFMEAGTFRPETGMTALTAKYIEKFISALPFFGAVSANFRRYWPEAHSLQQRLAELVPDVIIPGTDFSTLTINSNSLMTRAHTDNKNAVDTVSCLTTLGRFTGGHICLARWGVLVENNPGSLLVADIRDELHGNVGPVVGERIACIFYLRGGLLAETPTTGTAHYQAERGVKS